MSTLPHQGAADATTLGRLQARQDAFLSRAGSDRPLTGAAVHDALHQAIAAHGGSCHWRRLYAGWVVSLDYPEHHHFFGQSLEEALRWCLAWLVARQVTEAASLAPEPAAATSGRSG